MYTCYSTEDSTHLEMVWTWSQRWARWGLSLLGAAASRSPGYTCEQWETWVLHSPWSSSQWVRTTHWGVLARTAALERHERAGKEVWDTWQGWRSTSGLPLNLWHSHLLKFLKLILCVEPVTDTTILSASPPCALPGLGLWYPLHG